jgi:hypothetical protein
VHGLFANDALRVIVREKAQCFAPFAFQTPLKQNRLAVLTPMGFPNSMQSNVKGHFGLCDVTYRKHFKHDFFQMTHLDIKLLLPPHD